MRDFLILLLTLASISSEVIFAARDPIRLTHGPMLGHPTATSMRVWARTSDSGEFLVRYGTEENKLDQASKPAITEIENDNAGYATLKGLKSDQRYHYQVQVNGRPHGLPGSFLTLPSAPKAFSIFAFRLVHVPTKTRFMEMDTGVKPTRT
jgi:alkaline phosphatase D